MKTTVIYHSADFDGIFCREIARHFLPDAELIGWDFGQPLVKVDPICERLYVMDLPPDCVEGLTACGGLVFPEAQRLIWIDHHKTSIDKFPGDTPGYRIDGVAACRLAWQYFTLFHPSAGSFSLPVKSQYIDRFLVEPIAVRLAGEFDIWDKRDPDAEVFQFGLRSKELSKDDWKWLLTVRDANKQNEWELGKTNWIVNCLLKDGKLLQRYQQSNDAGTMHRSFIQPFEGLKFLALNTARCNSLTFAAKDIPETGHDALMGFYWNGQKWNISLYHSKHRTDIDLSAIAVKYNGGGHRGACGFSSIELPF